MDMAPAVTMWRLYYILDDKKECSSVLSMENWMIGADLQATTEATQVNGK